MISRLINTELRKSPKSILLLGPRQVGKSTLLQSLEPDLSLSLVDETDFLALSQSPGELEARIASTNAKTILIDEIQRLPSLFNSIQALLDQKKYKDKLKFYLSGSSARKLKRGKANLMPGRIITYEIGPLCSAELNYEMNTTKALEMGSLPQPYLNEDRKWQEKILSSYAGIYLKEEIQAEALTQNIQGFSRFLTVAAENAGRFLDLSKLSTKAKVSRQSAIRFFEILEDTMIAKRILNYDKIETADIVKHPRYFFFDQGVLNALLKNFTASADRIGNLFEHLFINQVINSAKARDQQIEIYGFRTRSGLEVDFLIEINKTLWAVETKATDNISTSDLSSLLQFRKKYFPKAKLAIAYTGNNPKKIDGISILPWQQLLKEMGL